jgi:pyruvate,water dikinase
MKIFHYKKFAAVQQYITKTVKIPSSYFPEKLGEVHMTRNVIGFGELRMTDVEHVGGKNASLGEMISQLSGSGVRVPGGFATTAQAYRDFLAHQGLAQRINSALDALDVDDVEALAKCGADIRQWIVDTPFPEQLEAEIRSHYEGLIADGSPDASFAVRSSATAEDLPDASFAGQQESFLNIHGLSNILHAIKEVFASLYNDRAISYRVHKNFRHADVALSAGVQRMVRSDLGASGVLFTMDTESGFKEVVFITASYGLGETVVQGAVNPDEFYVHKATLAQGKPSIIRRNLGSKMIKMVFSNAQSAGRSTSTVDVDEVDRQRFSLTNEDVLELARYAMIIEKHYGRPMDVEWGKDGQDGKLYILQARPETVKSQAGSAIEKYRLKQHGKVLATGRAIGQKIGTGPVRIVKDASQMSIVQAGDILVTDMTDPNWEPVMKKASAIVTNRGGRTCHAAIIARELGIPAIVGCGNATSVLAEGESVTVSCAEGDTGHVYRGILDFEVTYQDTGALPDLPLKIMMNVGNPELSFDFAQIPNGGVGLARLEFVINNMIGIHPKAVLEVDRVPAGMREEILRRSRGYESPRAFFVERLVEGVATIAASFYPKPVIVRLSDFKSNEYRKLLGGEIYEPEEENPMLGFRGASRYISPSFRDCFELECEAMKKVRDVLGLTNVELMVPFVRTLEEGRGVVDMLAAHGLKKGENNLRLIMMCEIPSNALLAEQFLEIFDGFSIGSNDLTQLTLGLDRDSGLVAASFDERDPAVKQLLSMAISTANRLGKYVGICGQGPSDHADFAEWLMDQGIQTISLNPDTVVATWLKLAAHAK